MNRKIRRLVHGLDSRRLVALLLATLVTAPAVSQAEEPTLTLRQAVDETIARDPEVHRAARQVEERRGIWLEQQGVFDNRLRLENAYVYDRRELIGARLQTEIDRRDLLEIAAGALELTGNELLARLRSQNVGDRPIEIRTDCGEFEDRLVVEADDGTYILCRDVAGNVRGLVLPEGISGGLNLDALLDDDLLDGIGEAIEAGVAVQIRSAADVLLRTAEILRAQRARLGDVPEVIEQVQLDLQLVYEWRLRSGLTIAPFLTLSGREENFAGKPRDPNFGDSTVPNLFTGSAGFEVLVPLGKNRGRRVVTAAERAAEAGYRASEALYRHVLSERVLATVDAYWRLTAARQRVEHLEASSQTRGELLEITDALIEGDELAAAERDRVAAQFAESRAELAEARRAWITARLDLARQIGIEPVALTEVPVADGELPGAMQHEEVQLEAYLAEIGSRREDLVAARHTEEAARILRDAAEANLRHQVDLSLNLSYNALHESFDQRAWDFGGFSDAWGGDLAGPSYGFLLKWRVPLRNRAARGQLLQAESSLARNRVAQTDLERTIRLRVGALHEALAEARAELLDLDRNVAAQRKVLESSRGLYEGGELSLLDVLVTEEQLIDAELSRVAAAERVALLEVRLRFESGRLVTARLDEDGSLSSWDLDLPRGG